MLGYADVCGLALAVQVIKFDHVLASFEAVCSGRPEADVEQ
jgi:hypothetical protein